jgi:hypothetical protein
MRYALRWTGILIWGIASIAAPTAPAQNTATGSAAPSDLAADYPAGSAGVLIQGSDWLPISAASPSRVRTKNGLAASLSYGAVRAVAEADYNGDHADIQITPARPAICVCQIASLPGDPILVKLHPQKGMRVLDGGKLPIIGAKIAEASKSDSIPVQVSHPENTVWVLRPLAALPAGEYALMLGSQNFVIYPFTVSATPADSSPEKN